MLKGALKNNLCFPMYQIPRIKQTDVPGIFTFSLGPHPLRSTGPRESHKQGNEQGTASFIPRMWLFVLGRRRPPSINTLVRQGVPSWLSQLQHV